MGVCIYGFCNVWVRVCVGFEICGCFDICVCDLVICVLLFVAFCYCFFYVYLFLFITSVRTSAPKYKFEGSI